MCLGTRPCRWEPGRTSYLAAPTLMGRMWQWTGMPLAGSPGGTGAQVPRAQAHGLGLFTLLLQVPLPSLSTQVTRRAWENCSMDAGSRRGLPTAPPPLGHLGWSWQHQVDQSWLMGPRKVAGQATVWGVEARGEAGGAWGPCLPGSPWAAPPLPVCWAPTRFPAGQASAGSATPPLHCLHPEAWHGVPSAGRP